MKTNFDPCRACGSLDAFIKADGMMGCPFRVYCPDCGATTVYHMTRDQATEGWNKTNKRSDQYAT